VNLRDQQTLRTTSINPNLTATEYQPADPQAGGGGRELAQQTEAIARRLVVEMDSRPGHAPCQQLTQQRAVITAAAAAADRLMQSPAPTQHSPADNNAITTSSSHPATAAAEEDQDEELLLS